MIFIFSTHVFDVGDLVMIDDQVRSFRPTVCINLTNPLHLVPNRQRVWPIFYHFPSC
jgi:hypothetical protein